METVESSEAIILLIVIAMLVILGICAIDLVFYKLFKRQPNKKKQKEKKVDVEIEKSRIDALEKELAELDKMDTRNK